MSEVHHVKKLKNAKFHSVYLHRPLQRYASLVYGSNKFWFCLFEMAWGIGYLLQLHTSRHVINRQAIIAVRKLII